MQETPQTIATRKLRQASRTSFYRCQLRFIIVSLFPKFCYSYYYVLRIIAAVVWILHNYYYD